MNRKSWNPLRTLPGFALAMMLMASSVNAQPEPAAAKSPDPKKAETKEVTKASTSKKTESAPTSATTGEDAGDYVITSTLEFGYRGIRTGGDVNKYKSDLNYKAGPRLFDSSFLMRAKDGHDDLFDTLLITTTGWGADPTGNLRLSVEKPEAYRFDASYRRFKYYRFLVNFANPAWSFAPQNQNTGVRGYDTRTTLGDFDLTILPKNETISFNVGYSPERYEGGYFSVYHAGGNDFLQLNNARHRADDFRVGANGKLGPIDWTILQGWRRFREDTFIDDVPSAINTASTAARLSTYTRNEPTRGKVNFTRASVHSLIADKLDITGRIIYSKATTNFNFVENFTGFNWNPRVTGWPPTSFPRVPPPGTVTVNATPNVLNLGQYNINGNTERPNTVFDLGVTYFATDKFRLSNTFRVEDFEIDGLNLFSDFFSITRTLPPTAGGGLRVDSVGFNNLPANEVTKYRKYLNTIEGDYQFNPNYAAHFGYRYGKRDVELFFEGFNHGSQGSLNPPAVPTTHQEFEENHTHAFFGGFKIRPVNNWTLFLDVEHGSSDNVFTRIGNYDYTNFRVKSRYAPNRKWNFNLGLITRDNSNPSEIAGVSLEDFGVETQSRIFTSSINWVPNSRFSVNGGYNYNWVTTDAIIDYTYLGTAGIRGNAIYYMRNNFFFIDTVTRVTQQVSLFVSYRVNKDDGQGNRLSDPAPTGARTMITSYPMSFQSPEARLAIRLHRRLDLNLGYQYFNYNEDGYLRTFASAPRAQNYHAHLPYASLRLYFGRKE